MFAYNPANLFGVVVLYRNVVKKIRKKKSKQKGKENKPERKQIRKNTSALILRTIRTLFVSGHCRKTTEREREREINREYCKRFGGGRGWVVWWGKSVGVG